MSASNISELKRHIGHKIVCIGYAMQNKKSGKRQSGWQNVAVECEDCNEVLMSFEKEEKKNGLSVIVNIDLEIPTNAKTIKKAVEEAENYELPSGYVKDSFEIVQVGDDSYRD